MLGMLLLLPWLLAPFAGFFLLVRSADDRTAEFLLAAPVSLVQATRAAETATDGRVIRAYVGTRRPLPRYVLIPAILTAWVGIGEVPATTTVLSGVMVLAAAFGRLLLER